MKFAPLALPARATLAEVPCMSTARAEPSTVYLAALGPALDEPLCPTEATKPEFRKRKAAGKNPPQRTLGSR